MLNVLDLFSGIGGFSLGLERTGGFNTVAFCEIDAAARKVLRKHWPHVPQFDDVKNLNGDGLALCEVPSIDVICGGFPCQDISLAGNGLGFAGARSGLWFEFFRLIDEIRPRYAIIENVAALRSRGLETILRQLASIGYHAEWHCIPASAVGAPHQRDRLWIVAYPAKGGYEHGRGQPHVHQADGGSYGSMRAIAIGASAQPENMAHAQGIGLQGIGEFETGERASEIIIARGGLARAYIENRTDRGWWAIEPNVGRVAHGVSGRVDRLKQLGNSVVPFIPTMIGYDILQHIDDGSNLV